MERDAATGKWQMLTPLAQRSCEAFGANDTLLSASWGDGRTSGSGGYAFNLNRAIEAPTGPVFSTLAGGYVELGHSPNG